MLIKIEDVSVEKASKVIEAIEKACKPFKASMTMVSGGENSGAMNLEMRLLSALPAYKDLKIPGYAPSECTQAGLAEAFDEDRSVISRHMGALLRKKLIRVKTLQVIGKARRLKCFFITTAGKEVLKLVNERIKSS